MMPELKGKIALVTGAARRIGKTIALALAERGAHVAITYHTASAGAVTTLHEIEARGVQGMMVQGDITRQEADAGHVKASEADDHREWIRGPHRAT